MSNCHFAVGSQARTNDELQREMFRLLEARALCACLSQRKNIVRAFKDLSGMRDEMQWLIPTLSGQVKGTGDESPLPLFIWHLQSVGGRVGRGDRAEKSSTD